MFQQHLTWGTLSGSLMSDSRGVYSCSESSRDISSTRRFLGAATRLLALSGFCRHTGHSGLGHSDCSRVTHSLGPEACPPGLTGFSRHTGRCVQGTGLQAQGRQ